MFPVYSSCIKKLWGTREKKSYSSCWEGKRLLTPKSPPQHKMTQDKIYKILRIMEKIMTQDFHNQSSHLHMRTAERVSQTYKHFLTVP